MNEPLRQYARVGRLTDIEDGAHVPTGAAMAGLES